MNTIIGWTIFFGVMFVIIVLALLAANAAFPNDGLVGPLLRRGNGGGNG